MTKEEEEEELEKILARGREHAVKALQEAIVEQHEQYLLVMRDLRRQLDNKDKKNA